MEGNGCYDYLVISTYYQRKVVYSNLAKEMRKIAQHVVAVAREI